MHRAHPAWSTQLRKWPSLVSKAAVLGDAYVSEAISHGFLAAVSIDDGELLWDRMKVGRMLAGDERTVVVRPKLDQTTLLGLWEQRVPGLLGESMANNPLRCPFLRAGGRHFVYTARTGPDYVRHGFLLEIDLSNGEILGEVPIQGTELTAWRGTLYNTASNHALWTFDGKEVNHIPMGGPTRYPMVTDDWIVTVGWFEGHQYRVWDRRAVRAVAAFPAERGPLRHPWVDATRMVVRDAEMIRCWDIRSGDERWSTPLREGLGRHCTIVDDVVAVTGHDRGAVLRADTGEFLSEEPYLRPPTPIEGGAIWCKEGVVSRVSVGGVGS